MTGYKKRILRHNLSIALLALTAVTIALFSLCYGRTIYSLRTVWDVLTGHESSFTIKTLRLPRMLAAVLSGFAFGISGYVFQTLLKNPLASPDIIGVSSASSVVAVFCILVLHINNIWTSIASVAAALIISLVIYFISSPKGTFSYAKMILVGIGMQAFLRAIINYLLVRTSEYDVGATLQWLSGSLNNVKIESIPRFFFAVIIVTIIILTFQRHLETLELGNDIATTLGVNTKITTAILILCAVFLVAFATAVTGPIASVAFLSGPIAVRIAGKSRSAVIPAGLVGILLVQLSDMVGQYAMPTRYPVGVITGILGAPYLLMAIAKNAFSKNY